MFHLISGMEKFLCNRGVGHDFFRVFCLTVPKKFIGVPLCVSQTFWYRSILWIRGVGGVSRFSARNVLPRSAEKNRTGILQCVTESGIENLFALEQ